MHGGGGPSHLCGAVIENACLAVVGGGGMYGISRVTSRVTKGRITNARVKRAVDVVVSVGVGIVVVVVGAFCGVIRILWQFRAAARHLLAAGRHPSTANVPARLPATRIAPGA